jgi:arginyl-tRNA synthetase
MGENLFDKLDGIAARDDGLALFSARSPFRPEPDFDLMLVPRVRSWESDPEASEALRRIEAEPWVEAIARRGNDVRVRLDSGWIAAAGATLETGEGIRVANADLAAGRRYAVYFWGANTTKALHIGHLRNLALGNAIGASLTQAGARVEHRSLICDVGRSMGEAMAGVVRSGRDQAASFEGEQKSDHFVGHCYADYVKVGRANGAGGDGAEDSVARESAMYNDKADELMMRVLAGDQAALELWSKTRAWVISGQRKTLARLGIGFDKVIFESDFLPEVAELTSQGLDEGKLVRRPGDEMVMYETEREELEEMPLVRADGLPTQHMRALAYWSAAPELDDDWISLQVCGTEWVAHVTCRRKLIDHLGVAGGNGSGSAKGGGPPTHDVFHGMVARENTSITSSKEGALLIDELAEWLEEEIAADPERAQIHRRHPAPDRLASQVALGYFLLQPTTKRVEFEPEKLLRAGKDSLGWDLARAQAHRGTASAAGVAAEDPEYRFAVVQSENYRRHLASAVEGFDVVAMSRYLSHFARWYRSGERRPEVDRVVQTVLDQGLRGLGLGA